MGNYNYSKMLLLYPTHNLVNIKGLKYETDVTDMFNLTPLAKAKVDLDNFDKIAEVAKYETIFYDFIYDRMEDYPVLDKNNIYDTVTKSKTISAALRRLDGQPKMLKTYTDKLKEILKKVDFTNYNKGVDDLKSKMLCPKYVIMMMNYNNIRIYTEVVNSSLGIEQAVLQCITEDGIEPKTIDEFVKDDILTMWN